MTASAAPVRWTGYAAAAGLPAAARASCSLFRPRDPLHRVATDKQPKRGKRL